MAGVFSTAHSKESLQVGHSAEADQGSFQEANGFIKCVRVRVCMRIKSEDVYNEHTEWQ